MTISRRGLLASAGALACALASCSGTDARPSASGTSEALTIGLTYIPNVQFSPFYVALERGYFWEAGLSVSLRHHGAQEDLFGALIGGTEQIVIASSDEAMVAAANGTGLQTFATMYQRYPVSVIVPAGSGVRALTGLAGKRVGLPGRYGSSYYGLLAGLAKAGMTEKDITLVEIGYTGVSALITSKVDAIVGFINNEPLQFAAQGFPVTAIDVVDPDAPTLVGPGLITAKGALDAAILAKVTRAVLDAEKAIVANPAEALDLSAKHVPDLADASARASAEKVLAATSKLWLVDKTPSLAIDKRAFARMSDLLHSAGITPVKVDPASVIAG